MDLKKRQNSKFVILLLVLVVAIFADLMAGSVWIPLSDFINTLFYGHGDSANIYIIRELRLTKTIAALLVGMALPVAGLLLQSLFRNPLAGPFVLGISSGASLGVASFVLFGGATYLGTSFLLAGGLSLFSIIGSLVVLLAVLAVATKVKDTFSLLIVGLMFGSITAALVSVMQYFSTPELLQQFIVWTFGSLGGFSWIQIILLASFVVVAILYSLKLIKPLNALLINEEYAASLGVSVKTVRISVIVISSILAGVVTAFAGPIVFIGVAVPHLARNLFKTSDHRIILPAVLLLGALLMLVCDIISQWPGSAVVLPINSVTAIFGAPIIIWIILQNKNSHARS